jgi:hypothetical protein
LQAHKTVVCVVYRAFHVNFVDSVANFLIIRWVCFGRPQLHTLRSCPLRRECHGQRPRLPWASVVSTHNGWYTLFASIRHINAVVLDMGAQQHSRYILYSLVPYVISFLLFCKTRTVQVRSLVAFL